jgi:hypothetical protein
MSQVSTEGIHGKRNTYCKFLEDSLKLDIMQKQSELLSKHHDARGMTKACLHTSWATIEINKELPVEVLQYRTYSLNLILRTIPFGSLKIASSGICC